MTNSDFFQPVSALEMPRFAGMPTFMRLPHLDMGAPEIADVEMGLIGVPWDAGTTKPRAASRAAPAARSLHHDPRHEPRYRHKPV